MLITFTRQTKSHLISSLYIHTSFKQIDVLVNKKKIVESTNDRHVNLAPKASDSFYIPVPLDIGNAGSRAHDTLENEPIQLTYFQFLCGLSHEVV